MVTIKLTHEKLRQVVSYFLSPSCASESSSNDSLPSKGPEGVVSAAVAPNTSTNMLTSLGGGSCDGDKLLTK